MRNCHQRLFLGLALTVTISIFAVAAYAAPDLPTIKRRLELDRFVGSWHVIANIPVRVPFFSDVDAYQYMQTYEILNDERILLRGTFKRAKHEGRSRSFKFKGFLKDPGTNAEWKIQYIWPIYSTYRVIYLDNNYETAIISVASRRWAWILSRNPDMTDTQLTELLKFVESVGFNPDDFRRVPATAPQPGET